jgi:hypothetical protein
MGILSRLILIILVIVFFLAILGLGWHTFFEGIKKGIDKLGITSIIENATGSATEIAKNASRDRVNNILDKTGTGQIMLL